ncbi:hypothetical protein FisN_12Hh365 [Fistulifera solaris]|uniref:Uncharacterized protein n=1 Tax=Fistulifera solaris TaxID=1519565 RepID=A0A1Z5KC14_FISSO|nr:hypothetical protein FisN_12Hh365 [Fistulifera solaris]|eukprot:GAX23787.1 hypothetical protein FisN_12Hh365 [Fistulifera solaris]
MKFTTLCLALLVSEPASAFAPHKKVNDVAPSQLFAKQPSRSEFLSQAAAIFVTGGIAFGGPSDAFAAQYGEFGKGSSPGVLDPKTAEIDADILKSDAVQSALKKVKGYRSAVQDMQAALKADSQVNVRKTIIKDLDFADLRDTLNTVNTAFEEDTQRGTDRLIRVIMQDITELEQANTQKDGIPRSPRRVEIMEGKLAKLEKAFSDFLAFSA